MIKLILPLLLLAAGSASALELPAGDAVFSAMKDELARSAARLEMDRLGKPHFLAYQVLDGHSFGVSASFGELEKASSRDYRSLKADLRLGSYALDNSHYAPSAWDGYTAESDSFAPIEENYDALRFALWSVTDRAYKKALETYSKKKAFIESKNLAELYDDLTPQPVSGLLRPAAAERLDEEGWKETVRRVSAVFKGYPAVKHSSVIMNFSSGRVSYLNSEGSFYRQPSCSGSVYISASGYARDNFPLRAAYREDFCLAKDAPSREKLLARAAALGAEITAKGKSEPLQAYIGPVLLEETAAGRFFEALLVANVANPREIWTEKSRWTPDSVFRRAGQLVERLGMRVTSSFLNVVDDPLARYHEGRPLPGFYEADDEGVPAKKIGLVTKGKLTDYYMSRAATRDYKRSNGHGRADLDDYPAGAPSNVFITPEENSPRALPLAELRRKFLELCREEEQEYCLRVTSFDNLNAPFSAWKVYLDGHEEPVHGIEFTGVTLRALRDIAAVSRETYVHSLGWSKPGAIVTPAVLLLQEMEIKKTEVKPEKKPYLPHPYFGK
ncbi:MAG: metallopeptidase TldD-related protein [Elusimicrobiales bacterium]|nr:metallopeptidase TldD-related protein [Elusimicrobiales bacterium]